ncbi:MAG: N-acetylmuramoyl-L-alanine amidase [Kiritimatiellae bacterium]|jgi:N-acetylmuramoyl-L-alanine amidase|nr:N-acetylmuramoyl-L-alanine amidase [Kiritimatiellia bacterium]
MKLNLHIILLFLFSAFNLPAVEVQITFPPEGSTLFTGPQTFVAGNIKPAETQLSINKKTIVPYRTGSFLFMQTMIPGKNILNIKSGSFETKHIFFFSQPKPKPAPPKITPLYPVRTSGVITGKTFRISCKAPAGSNPQVQVGERTISLKANKQYKDIWSIPLRLSCPLKDLPVTFFAKGLQDVKAGSLNTLNAPESFKVIGELFSTRARSKPDAGEIIAFLYPGDIIASSGYEGSYRKMAINAKECYVNSKYLEQIKLTQGTSADLKRTDITDGYGPFPPTKKKAKDILLVLDAGHGGTDSGAIGPSGLKENEVTLKQVLLLKDVFEKAGYQTLLTRSTDDYVGLYDRVRAGYNKRADAFISIHYNSCPSQQNPRDRRHISTYAWNKIGKELAKPVNTELGKISPVRNAGVLYGNLAVCRNPAVPSILIELDFITSPEGEELIQTTKFQREAAEAILRGIQSWCGN